MIKERPKPRGILKNLIDVRALLGCAERPLVRLTWVPALEEVLISAMTTSGTWLLWIDPVSCQERERLRLPGDYKRVACSADGESLYVAGDTWKDSGRLLLVRRPYGGTATISAELPLDAGPSWVAAHPTEPLLYVSGCSSAWSKRRPDYGLVWVVDTARWQIQATIQELMGPTGHIAFALDGHAAYVSTWRAGVTVLDAIRHIRQGNYSVSRAQWIRPRKGSEGEELWVGAENRIEVLDPQQGQPIATVMLGDINDGLGDFAFSGDEQWAYATCLNKRRLDLIDCQAYRVVENYRLDFAPYTILYVPTTEHLWVEHYGEPWVYVLALPDR